MYQSTSTKLVIIESEKCWDREQHKILLRNIRNTESYVTHPDRNKPHLNRLLLSVIGSTCMGVFLCMWGNLHSFVLSGTRFLIVTSRVSSNQIFISNKKFRSSLT